jgi:PKD repeat protein
MIKIKKETVSGILLTVLATSMFFSAISPVKSQMETHDLRVVLEAGLNSGGHHLTLGKSRIINATVWNDGNISEPTVTLLLLINDSEVLHSAISNLLNGTSSGISYTWYPSESGVYNMTAYAPAITYPEPETNTANNVASWLIYVCNDTAPTVDFTYSPQLPGPIAAENVTFDASSTYDPDWGNITAYSWNFNGTIKNTTEPFCIYNFAAYGNVTVILTEYDTEGKSNSTSKQLRIYARPVAFFTASGLHYAGYPMVFDASFSYDPDNQTGPKKGIVTYTWDFGDGSPPFVTGETNTTHTYVMNGTYAAYLKVTDYDNLNSSYPGNMVIDPVIPKANFIVTSPRALPGPYNIGEILTLDASTSTPDGGNISSYFWNWNDGTLNDTTAVPVITHAFAQSGTYNVALIVTDTDNKSSTPAIKSINVILRVSLEVTNSTGGTSVTANPPAGIFKVNVSIKNVAALDYFEFILKYPQGSPPPLLSGEKVDQGDFVLGEWAASDYLGQIRVTSTAHIGGASGNFTLAVITFTVTNPGNCTLYISSSILRNSTGGTINCTLLSCNFYTTKPLADFNSTPYKPVANMTTVTFDASASFDPDNMAAPNKGIAYYTWDFNDNSTTIASDPSTLHLYESPGFYNVNLTVTDYANEKWSITRTVEVISGRDVAVVLIEPNMLQFNATLDQYETAGILPIDVTVKNEGDSVSENFNVTIYFNNTNIKTQLVTDLMPGQSETVKFNCDIRILTKGTYAVIANASLVWGEADALDNILYVDHLVMVHLKGDITRDGSTDLFDAIYISVTWGSKPGDMMWYLNADLNCNGHIDIYDAVIVAENLNRKDP